MPPVAATTVPTGTSITLTYEYSGLSRWKSSSAIRIEARVESALR